MAATRIQLVDRARQVLASMVLILVGIGWAMDWSLFRSSWFLYGAAGDCGASAVDAVSTSHDDLAQHCERIGLLHVTIGVVVGGLIAWGGLLLLLDAMAPDRRAGTAPSRRRLRVSACFAAALVVLTVIVAGAHAYAAGSRTPTFAQETSG